MIKSHVRRFTAKDVERANKRMILRGQGLLPKEGQRFCVIRVARPTLKLTAQQIDDAGRRAMRKHVAEI